ncbi:hypothetical protein C8J56DRAFT_362654 [Mycena floridula]|nr:hypothetical protein C8J56DRAFT_362654 [Mycena floridula]
MNLAMSSPALAKTLSMIQSTKNPNRFDVVFRGSLGKYRTVELDALRHNIWVDGRYWEAIHGQNEASQAIRLASTPNPYGPVTGSRGFSYKGRNYYFYENRKEIYMMYMMTDLNHQTVAHARWTGFLGRHEMVPNGANIDIFTLDKNLTILFLMAVGVKVLDAY